MRLRLFGMLLGLLSLTLACAVRDRPANVIIPNIDDDNGDGLPDGRAALSHGAADEEILQLHFKSPAGLPDRTFIRAEVGEPWANFTRLSLRDPDSGAFIEIRSPLLVDSKAARRDGITVGVEALDFPDPGRPPQFNVTIRFESEDGRRLGEESVACAVAPFLVSCCLDRPESVHVVKTSLTDQFVADLSALVEDAGFKMDIVEDPALPEHDIWIQDATEIGYATDGRRVMFVAMHGNRGEKLDDLFAARYLGRDRGVVFRGGDRGESAEWIDWYGNLEASPPLDAGDKKFSRGRVYAGTQGERALHPEVVGFLEAQGAQGPVLWLDTSWLIIGHVDETVSWVPSKVGRPIRMLLPSTRLAVEILKAALKQAPGCVVNQGTAREGDRFDAFEKPVAQVLEDADLMKVQEVAQGKIDGVRRTLQAELGVADGDIIEIPVLFGPGWDEFPGRYGALTVNMVNGLLLGDVFIVPDPHGPYVDGRDVLLQAVKDRLEPLGLSVRAVDNFRPYHLYGGEVHCGTNVTRSPSALR